MTDALHVSRFEIKFYFQQRNKSISQRAEQNFYCPLLQLGELK